jgi:hypothetical protein
MQITPPIDVNERPPNVASLTTTSPLPVNDRREQSESESAGKMIVK